MKTLLKDILDTSFLESLAKSADLYKIGSNSVLDPDEIFIGFNVVPRAVMSLMLSELTPMEINASNTIHLPFGKDAFMNANKNACDDYTGSIYDDGKLVYSFQNRSIPGLALILLSTFELYDLDQLKDKGHHDEDTDRKVQKLIDERMELHSLISKVVEDKISQRDAIHKLMMDKLNDALKREEKVKHSISEVTKIAKDPGNAGANDYLHGMANGVEVANAIVHNKEAEFIDKPKKPLEVKAADIVKKEKPPKGSPLKTFLERKKKVKPKEYRVELSKSEKINCDDCGQLIYGNGIFAGCICWGENQHSKIFVKKSEDGDLSIRFSRNWSIDNIQMLLETLRRKNG